MPAVRAPGRPLAGRALTRQCVVHEYCELGLALFLRALHIARPPGLALIRTFVVPPLALLRASCLHVVPPRGARSRFVSLRRALILGVGPILVGKPRGVIRGIKLLDAPGVVSCVVRLIVFTPPRVVGSRVRRRPSRLASAHEVAVERVVVVLAARCHRIASARDDGISQLRARDENPCPGLAKQAVAERFATQFGQSELQRRFAA